MSGKVQFTFRQSPTLIELKQTNNLTLIEAQLKKLSPQESLQPSSFALVLVKGAESIPGNSYFAGDGRTFISFVQDDFDLKKTLDRLQEVQFRTIQENMVAAVKPLFRTQKLRFIVLGGDSSELAAGFHRYFGPFLSALSGLFNFDVRFQEQAISTIPEFSPEFFSGSQPIARFNENDEIGPEQPFRFVLLASDEAEAVNHFYIPGWGVVARGKADHSTLQLFISAYRKHLGLSDVPFGAFSSSTGITAVELDVFTFALQKAYARETLRLLQLTKSLKNEPISASLFESTFPAIQETFLTNPQAAFLHAYRLHYDPSRLGPPYFPDEHKFAVYLPVILPLVLPLVVGLLKLLKQKKKSSEKQKQQ